MRRRPHIGGQASEPLDELSPDARIAFGFEFASAIVANRQEDLHQLHGVSFRRTRNSPSVSAATWQSVVPTACFSNRSDARASRPNFAAPRSKNRFFAHLQAPCSAKEQLRFECVGTSPWRNQ